MIQKELHYADERARNWMEEELGLTIKSIKRSGRHLTIMCTPTCFDSFGWQFSEIIQEYGKRNVNTDQYGSDVIIDITTPTGI